jgi:hypothetical protein
MAVGVRRVALVTPGIDVKRHHGLDFPEPCLWTTAPKRQMAGWRLYFQVTAPSLPPSACKLSRLKCSSCALSKLNGNQSSIRADVVQLQLQRNQSLMTLLWSPDASQCPSGLIARQWMNCVCPMNVCTSTPEFAFHSATAFPPVDASHSLPGPKAR